MPQYLKSILDLQFCLSGLAGIFLRFQKVAR
jgi:hypothetical protein